MEMTYERAAEILDPEHREAYDSIEPVITACNLVIARIATKLFIGQHCSSKCIASSAAKH